MTTLNLDSLREAIAPRLAAAHLETDPFPHLWVDDVWPDEFYARLEASWPPDHAFFANKKSQKWNLQPGSTSLAGKRGDFSALSPEDQALWSFVVDQVNAQIIGPWLADVFRDHVQERMETFRAWERGGRVLPHGIQADRWHVTRGRLMMRANGFVLKPHCDGASFIVTALYYFGGGEEDQHGTILYRAERPLPLEVFLHDSTTEYFHNHNIPVHEARRIAFRPNRLVAFPNRLDAAHGLVAPAGPTRRKVLQFHVGFPDGQAAAQEY